MKKLFSTKILINMVLNGLILLLSNNVNGQVPFYVDTTGLVGWWSFTGNTNDSSGHGNNGTLYGATLTNDRFGNPNCAYSFNGTTDYIQISDNSSLELINHFTLSVWVKLIDYSLNTLANPARTIISKPRTANLIGYCVRSLDVTSTTDSFRYDGNFNDGTTNFYTLSPDTLPLTTWTNVIYTYDGSVAKLYKNGVSVSSNTIVMSLPATTQPLFFGKEFNTTDVNSRWFKGSLDDIGIWNRALTPCEIMKLYLSGNFGIVNQPNNDTVITDGLATFTIIDTDSVATYQWQQNAGTGFVNLSNHTYRLTVNYNVRKAYQNIASYKINADF